MGSPWWGHPMTHLHPASSQLLSGGACGGVESQRRFGTRPGKVGSSPSILRQSPRFLSVLLLKSAWRWRCNGETAAVAPAPRGHGSHNACEISLSLRRLVCITSTCGSLAPLPPPTNTSSLSTRPPSCAPGRPCCTPLRWRTTHTKSWRTKLPRPAQRLH